MTYGVGVGLLVASMSLACSERTLSPDNAAKLISALDGFKREAHFKIETGVPLQSAFRCYTQAEVERMPLNQFVAERGWVRYEQREAAIGFGAKASCPAMALTPAGEAASGQWARRGVLGNQGTMWTVPIGRRELVDVTELAPAPDGSTQVEFDWRWVPNETGTAMRSSVPKADVFFNQTRKGRASCQRDDEWQCKLGIWATAADALGELSVPQL